MRTSDTISKIAPALVEIQDAMTVEKTAENSFLKNKYAPIEVILQVIRPSLKENGLTVFQSTPTDEQNVRCITRVIHESGEWMESEVSIKAQAATPQGLGSAVTYARRYGLCAALSISTHDDMDDDAKTAQEEQRKRKESKDEVESLNIYKMAVKKKLLSFDPESLFEAFEASGFVSDKDDLNEWLDDVLRQVPNKAKIDAIGKLAKSKFEEAEKAKNDA